MSYDTGWIRGLSAHELARNCNCGAYPDSEGSEGALFLKRVARSVADAMDDGSIYYSASYEEHENLTDWSEGQGSGYTLTDCKAVLDLEAWDPDEYEIEGGDSFREVLTRLLDAIAYDLARNLASGAWSDDEEEDEYDEEETEEEELELVPVIPGLNFYQPVG